MPTDYLAERTAFIRSTAPLLLRHDRMPLIVEEVVVHAAGRGEYIAEATRNSWMEFGATPLEALNHLRQEIESVFEDR